MIIQEDKITNVISVLKSVHPYEEVAYDLYPLKNKGQAFGLGRIGYLENKMTLASLCQKVKEAFQVSNVRFTGSPEDLVEKVAVEGGSGEKYIQKAFNKKAYFLITGYMILHIAQGAKEIV